MKLTNKHPNIIGWLKITATTFDSGSPCTITFEFYQIDWPSEGVEPGRILISNVYEPAERPEGKYSSSALVEYASMKFVDPS